MDIYRFSVLPYRSAHVDGRAVRRSDEGPRILHLHAPPFHEARPRPGGRIVECLRARLHRTSHGRIDREGKPKQIKLASFEIRKTPRQDRQGTSSAVSPASTSSGPGTCPFASFIPGVCKPSLQWHSTCRSSTVNSTHHLLSKIHGIACFGESDSVLLSESLRPIRQNAN
jgi:hypothetical protein